jgi:hypothetical protein
MITPRITPDQEIEVILIRAAGEDNRRPPDDVAINGYERRVRRRNPVTTNEWMVTVVTSTAVASFASAVVQAIAAWVNSRNGRRYKIRHGDNEYEAPSISEMKKLIKLAGDELEIRVLPPTGEIKRRNRK